MSLLNKNMFVASGVKPPDSRLGKPKNVRMAWLGWGDIVLRL